MIEDLLQQIGIEDLQPRDSEIGGRCPRHEERTGEREQHPRHFFVNRSTGVFHCFSCEYSGSLVKLIMDQTKMGVWEAHQQIHRFDIELGAVDEVWVPPVPNVQLEVALDRFGPPPDRAVLHRGLSQEACKHYGVRWDDDVMGWVLPIFGPTGDLWGWQIKTKEWVRNRPPGIRKSHTLFGLHCAGTTGRVILVESPLDAVYLGALQFPAVASFGAAVSDYQMRLIIQYFDEVVLALDNDSAGHRETGRLMAERWHHRIPTKVFNYERAKGKDPGELRPQEVEAGIDNSVMAVFW